MPLISFTGSIKVGKEIAQAAALNLKRVGIELSGKTPDFVFIVHALDAALPVIERPREPSSELLAFRFIRSGMQVARDGAENVARWVCDHAPTERSVVNAAASMECRYDARFAPGATVRDLGPSSDQFSFVFRHGLPQSRTSRLSP